MPSQAFNKFRRLMLILLWMLQKTPFGYTRKDVLLIGLGVTLLGIGLKSGLEVPCFLLMRHLCIFLIFFPSKSFYLAYSNS